jgi:hypothetical protein
MTSLLSLLGTLLLGTLANGYTFPYGRCYDKKCGSSPYRLTWLPEVTEGQYCLQFQTVPCVDTQYKCCSLLSEALVKFELHVRTECKDAFKRVTIDGVTKGGGVFFDVYTEAHSELRITSMTGINKDNVQGKTFCIHVTKPCIPMSRFLYSNNTAVWEVKKHECCPRCLALSPPPPPSPTPPLPVPPRRPARSPPPPPPRSCGNGICEPDLGEHCGTCKKDCRGNLKFCCGLDRPLCKQPKCFKKGYVCGRTNVTRT